MRSLARCKVLALLLICAPALHAQDSVWNIPGNEQLYQILDEQLSPIGTGAVLGIIEPSGQRIVTWGRSGSDRPLDEHTVFMIASLTKVFTSLLLADMAVRGEVSLDDSLTKYLVPGIGMPRGNPSLTLMDLSKHRSGLPSMPSTFPLDGSPNPYSALTESEFYRFVASYKLPRAPVTIYSNVGVALLGKVLSLRSGKSYDGILRERVLEPLGMTSTAVTMFPQMQARLAPGHDRYGELVESWDILTMPASGGLRSTVRDLLLFLDRNIKHDSPLEAAMQLQRTPGKVLGWGRSMLSGEEVFGHEGGKEGYQSAMIYNPARGSGVVLLMNGRSGNTPMTIARHILNRSAVLPPAPPRPEKPVFVTLEREQLDRFTGTWHSDSSDVRIARRDDHLLFYPRGGGISVLWPTSLTHFHSKVSGEIISFDTTQPRTRLCVNQQCTFFQHQ